MLYVASCGIIQIGSALALRVNMELGESFYYGLAYHITGFVD